MVVSEVKGTVFSAYLGIHLHGSLRMLNIETSVRHRPTRESCSRSDSSNVPGSSEGFHQEADGGGAFTAAAAAQFSIFFNSSNLSRLYTLPAVFIFNVICIGIGLYRDVQYAMFHTSF